jgi:hypothetical protein
MVNIKKYYTNKQYLKHLLKEDIETVKTKINDLNEVLTKDLKTNYLETVNKKE